MNCWFILSEGVIRSISVEEMSLGRALIDFSFVLIWLLSRIDGFPGGLNSQCP